MYAIYKQKKFEAENVVGDEVTLYSYVKYEGFQNHIDPWGEVSDNFFSKQVNMEDLDYLYSIRYEIQYKGRFFSFHNGDFSKIIIYKDRYYIGTGDFSLAEQLGFEREDKLYFRKKLHRKDIEAIKIMEIPEGKFSDQDIKITIVKGKEIDDFLATFLRKPPLYCFI